MTELETPLSDPALEPRAEQGPAPRPGRIRRVIEWFWGGTAMRSIVRTAAHQAAHELERRSLVSLELARAAIEQSFQHGSAEPLAADLTRQAVYWALLARRVLDSNGLPPPDAARPTFAELWSGASAAVIAGAAGNEGEAEFLAEEIREGSFERFADMEPAVRMRATLGMRRVAHALLREVDAAEREIDRIWMRRVTRIGGVTLSIALAVVAVVVALNSLEQRRNVARGKPWVASSSFGVGGCSSPQQTCADSPAYFFHTREEATPWLSIDLESAQRVSAIRIINRSDCCHERAVPLVVELSLDQRTWKRVAERSAEFSDWKASFPATSARWVKITVLRPSMLHLQEVRVLR